MNKFSSTAALIICLIVVLVSKNYFTISFFITGIALWGFISNFSKTSIIPDIIALYSCFLYLMGPYLGYKYFFKAFEPAVIMNQWMRVSKEDYYAYALPAIILFMIGLNLVRISNEDSLLRDAIYRLKNSVNLKMGIYFIMVGVASFYLRYIAPEFLQYVFTILFLFVFAGFLILYFSRKGGWLRYLFLIGICLWILYYGIRSGMFTIVFYMGVTLVGIIFIGKNISIPKKGLALAIGFILTITLQFVKSNYRLLIRRGVEKEMTVGTFMTLYGQTLSNVNKASSLENLFSLYLRFNNGYNLSLVMNRIPQRQPFDHGEALFKSVIASFVPRLFWPEKPMSGGIFNMNYYAGIKIDSYSTNVGPIGEAYGSFGRTGGSVFMLFFGLALGLMHRIVVSLSYGKPILLIFMPVLFYEVIFCMENDTMQALNSFVKTAFLLYVLFKLLPGLIKPKGQSAHSLTVHI